MKPHRFFLFFSCAAVLALFAACSKEEEIAETTAGIIIEGEAVSSDETAASLSPDGALLPSLADIDAEFSEPIPDVLKPGMSHPVVARLQERLMELGFMDDDEPTEFYGDVTAAAVRIYQRQNKLSQDGMVGIETLRAILAPDAKYYAAQPGDTGTDITRIQTRLYETGYLAKESQITGSFDDATTEAVIQMQKTNGLSQDGLVGRKTINLLYSDDLKANMLAYGDKSDVVLAAQQRLFALGYLTTTPDGSYGTDTILAVKRFQSKNDQVVDGFLGPSTRAVLDSSSAIPNGFSLGDSGENITRIQKSLADLGYLKSANATGYYGELTQAAVKLFQQTNKLIADGTAGTQTITALQSGKAKKAPAGTANRLQGSTVSQGSSSTSKSSGKTSAAAPATGTASGGASTLLSVARSKLGSPYVWGSKGPSSFDCSGFVYWCLNHAGVSQSYITSSGWRNVGKYTRISSFSDLRAGDIIVVSGHVGIVAEGGTVIDASSSNGRVVNRGLGSWWASHFICGWRIFA